MSGVALLLMALFAAAPGGAVFFDGLPFDHAAEFLLLVALAVSRRALPAGALIAIAVAGLVLKLSVVSLGGYSGFIACYEGGAGARLERCTPSYDDPFSRFSATRVDAHVNFVGVGWRLGLLNSRRFDAERDNSAAMRGLEGQAAVDSPPTEDHAIPPVAFAARWTTVATATATAPLRLHYVGEAAVTVDGVRSVLAPAYATGATREWTLLPGRHQLQIDYRFAPALTPPPSPPVIAELRLDAPATVQFGVITSLGRLMGVAADALGVAALLLLVAICAWRAPEVAIAAAGVLGVAALLIIAPLPAWTRDKALELLVVGWCVAWMKRRWDMPAVVVALAALCLMRVAWGCGPVPGIVHYRYWGDDGLTYDSFARDIFETWTLRAGEPVFRGQPLFRYIRFIERLLLGEDEWLIVVAALLGFNLAYTWAGKRAMEQRPAAWMSILPLTALLLWIVNGLTGLVEGGMTEYPTWIVIPLAMPLLLLARSPRERLLGAALCGVGVLVRFNHLPAYAIVLGVFALRSGRQSQSAAETWRALALAALVVTVPMLLHNVWYGGQWRVIPDSAAVNTDLPLAKWTLETMGDRVRLLLHLGTKAPTSFLPLHVLQIGLVATLLAVLRGGIRVDKWYGWLMLAPVAALAVHLIFAVDVYYPRHILFGYLLGGVISLVLLAASDANARGYSRG
jgi:hypothetical protein